jgi:thioester reductase-like protein
MFKVLVTGATGFLGGELLMELSKVRAVEKIVCLVRASNEGDAGRRLERAFALHGDHYDREKVIAVPADLLDSRLSYDLLRDSRLRDVNVVIHAAANTSFLPQKRAAVEATNVFGTRRLLDWALNLDSLETFAYVGTATMVGCSPDVIGRTIIETEDLECSAEHLVGYTRSKMLAELEVRSRVPAEKLLVIRPSILVGDSRCIVPRSYDIAWIVAAFQRLRIIFSSPDAACDILPVDYAARAIVKLLMAERRFVMYHVSAGRSASTLGEIGKATVPSWQDAPPLVFATEDDLKALKSWLRGNPPEPRLRAYKKHLEYLKESVGMRETRLLLSGLDAYWKFMHLDQRFDNARLLSDTDIEAPEPAHHYLERTLSFLECVDPLVAAVNP